MTTQQYTRMALVGRADATSPADGEIAPWAAIAYQNILALYPCLGDTYASQAAFEAFEPGARWLGYATAIEMRQGGWRLGAGPVAGYGLAAITVQKADVKEEYRRTSDTAEQDEIDRFEAVIARAKQSFPCVAQTSSAKKAAAPLSLAGKSGKNRSGGCRC